MCIPQPPVEDGPVEASVWGRGGGGATMGRVAAVAFLATCLAVLGLLLGAPLGLLAGALWTWLAGMGTGHGQGDLLILVTFGPLGALLGGTALPAIYLVRLLRRRWRGRPAAGGPHLENRRS